MQEQAVGGGEAAAQSELSCSEPAVKHGNIPEVGSRFGSLGVPMLLLLPPRKRVEISAVRFFQEEDLRLFVHT